MGDSCFYGHDANRPDPPFPRTKLSNVYLNGGNTLTLTVNNAPITGKAIRKYRLFPRDVVVGDYPFTWHHNVPWNLLRKSWDIVVTFCSAGVLQRLFAFYVKGHPKDTQAEALIAKVLALQAAAAPNSSATGERSVGSKTVGDWVTAVNTFMTTSNDGKIAFADEDRNDLRLILCWGAWNLNEGPGVRIDDPDELFDDFGAFDAHEHLRARYTAVARLNATLLTMKSEFDALENVRSSYAATGQAWSDALDETLRVCEALNPSQRQIAYFDPMMWAPVTPSGRPEVEQNFPKQFEIINGMVVVLRTVKCYIQMKKKVPAGAFG
jgi:hypothetical protein